MLQSKTSDKNGKQVNFFKRIFLGFIMQDKIGNVAMASVRPVLKIASYLVLIWEQIQSIEDDYPQLQALSQQR